MHKNSRPIPPPRAPIRSAAAVSVRAAPKIIPRPGRQPIPSSAGRRLPRVILPAAAVILAGAACWLWVPSPPGTLPNISGNTTMTEHDLVQLRADVSSSQLKIESLERRHAGLAQDLADIDAKIRKFELDVLGFNWSHKEIVVAIEAAKSGLSNSNNSHTPTFDDVLKTSIGVGGLVYALSDPNNSFKVLLRQESTNQLRAEQQAHRCVVQKELDDASAELDSQRMKHAQLVSKLP